MTKRLIDEAIKAGMSPKQLVKLGEETAAQLEKASETPEKFRKGTFEAKMDLMLPTDIQSFDVVAFELLRDEGSWSVNDAWTMASGVDREEAISALRGRWEVFKLNYAPRACVKDITDCGDGWQGETKLEVDCTAFADVRNAEL
jgi:hypothetical protein